jgi:DNA polymerase-4
LKVKYADFQQVTRSRSFATPMDNKAALEHASIELLKPLLPVSKGVRLLGITLSALGTDEDDESPQMTLAL